MRTFLPLLILWVLVTGALFIWKDALQVAGVDVNFILVANALLFLLTMLGFVIIARTAKASSPHAFMRGIFTSFLLKIFVIVTALFIFISMVKDVNTLAIFISLGLYVVYTGVEVVQLMKMVRKLGK